MITYNFFVICKERKSIHEVKLRGYVTSQYVLVNISTHENDIINISQSLFRICDFLNIF